VDNPLFWLDQNLQGRDTLGCTRERSYFLTAGASQRHRGVIASAIAPTDRMEEHLSREEEDLLNLFDDQKKINFFERTSHERYNDERVISVSIFTIEIRLIILYNYFCKYIF